MKTITKDELENLYLNNLNDVVCKKLGITQPTLRVLLRKNNIPLKGRGNHQRKVKVQVI